MIRFGNVLVFCSERQGSVEALGLGVDLAQETGARLTVMDVLQGIGLPEHSGLDFERMAARARAERAAELAARADSLHPARAPEIVVGTGDPAVELVRRVLTHGHDLLLKTARGADRQHRSFFGGTARRLVRLCPCPVWLVAPEALPDRPRIVVAIDPVSGSGGSAFAARILDHGRALARNLDGELQVVHVWNPTAAAMIRRYAGKALLEQYLEEARRAAESAVEQLMGGSDPELQIHVLEGDARDVIPEFARRHRADVVVMGSVGRSGLSGLLIGEMAEEVLAELECGLFSLKPEGFVSPLRLDAP